MHLVTGDEISQRFPFFNEVLRDDAIFEVFIPMLGSWMVGQSRSSTHRAKIVLIPMFGSGIFATSRRYKQEAK